MKDEADRIIEELLARDGQPTMAHFRKQALEQMQLVGENPNTAVGREFLKRTMISIAAKDDAEADALLARADGMELTLSAQLVELSDDAKRAAHKAIERMATEVSRKQRRGSPLH